MALSELSISEKLSWRDVNEELVALDVGTGEYHVFNDIGRKIWLHIAEQNPDMDALVAGIKAEYNTQKHDVGADIQEFVNDLLDRRLITRKKKGQENGKPS